MRILSFLIFVPLQIAFLPLAVLGFIIVAYKQIVVSRRLGVSQTGIEVLNGRWTMHVFGMRHDVATARLAAALPNTSTLGLWLVLFPLWVKYKISGVNFAYPRVASEGGEDVRDLVISRTLYFDRIVRRVVGDVDQFVVLGAGYDTRAYGETRREGLASFELDQDSTQRLKVASLEAAGIDAAHVTFIAVDFRYEDAFEKLRVAGYDPTKKTLFLWEGVTLYLAEEHVRRTLRAVREHSAPGSIVVADIYGERFLQLGGRMGRKTLDYTGEALSFGLPFATEHEEELRLFLESEHMTQGETYFMGRTNKKGPFMVVAELGV